MKRTTIDKYNRLLNVINDEDMIKNLIKRLENDISYTKRKIKEFKVWQKFSEYKDDKNLSNNIQRELEELSILNNKKQVLVEYLKIK